MSNRYRMLAGVVALAAVAAACGDDSSSSDTTKAAGAATTAGTATTAGSATTAGGATTTAAAKGTVKIGVLGSSANSVGPQPEEAKKLADVWAAGINAAGGVNGYKVEVVYRDVANDAAKTLQAVQELEAAGVVSISQGGVGSLFNAASLQVFSDKLLPVLGGTPYNPAYDTNPMLFQISSSYVAGVWGQVSAAKHAGADHFRNVYCTEVPACASSVPVTEAAAKALGMTHSAAGASARATSYTATCLDAKNAKVTFFQSNGLNTPNVIKDCSDQNYHPVYGVGGAANAATVAAIGSEKYAGNLYEFGVFYTGPEVTKFRTTMGKTDVKEADWTQNAVHTWLSLQMTEKVLAKMTKANATRADFVAALQTIKGEDLGGQIAPVDYTKQTGGGHFQQDCWTEQTIAGGKLTHMGADGKPVTKLTFICDATLVHAKA